MKGATMNLKDAIKPITHGTLVITQHGEAKAVLQDIDEYDRTQQALMLLQRLAQGQIEHAQGKTIPAEQVIADLNRRINQDYSE